MKTPTASSATSSQREQTSLLSQMPRSPRSNVCSTPDPENPSASVHPKRFSTPSLTLKFLCAGKLNPRKEINHAAQALFEQALKIDPNDADALAGAAYTYFLVYVYEWITPETDYEAKILSQLDRAIALDPDNLWAYYVKSQYLASSNRPKESLSAGD